MVTNKVYAVSSGSYSDYRIEAVFSTKKKAQEYIDAHPKAEYSWDEKGIETWDLDPVMYKPREGYAWFSVRMGLQTTGGEEVHQHPSVKMALPLVPQEDTVSYWAGWKWPAAHFYIEGKWRIANVYVAPFIEAKDEQHALKIVNERRAAWLASHPVAKDGQKVD